MKIFKLIGIMSLLVFSFYLTDFVTELAMNSNPLMKSIRDNSKNYCVSSVNAIIEKNTIIPGIKGKVVNEVDSFLKMKDFNAFNINYLVYDYIKPDISLEDNKDKVIISGNKNRREISLLIKDNKEIIKYLEDNNIKYSKLVKKNEELISKENINIESEEDKYKDLDTLLKKKDLNKKICILNYSNIKVCKEKKYYLVEPSIELKNSNFISSLKFIDVGSIIMIDDNFLIENFKTLFKYINSKDIDFVYLSDLIKE